MHMWVLERLVRLNVIVGTELMEAMGVVAPNAHVGARKAGAAQCNCGN